MLMFGLSRMLLTLEPPLPPIGRLPPDEPVPAVQEPGLEDVHPDEPPHRAEEELDGSDSPALPVGVRGAPLGVPVELLQVLAEGAEGVVEKGVSKNRHVPLGSDVGVNPALRIPRGSASKDGWSRAT